MKKALWIILSVLVVAALSITLVGCNNTPNSQQQSSSGYKLDFNTVYALAEEKGYDGTLEDLIALFKGDNAYQLAVASGYTGTQQEWLLSLVGAKGADGTTPTIGANKHWFIGDVDTGVVAEGKDGTSVTVTSVNKTKTEGLVDTYTITFSNGTSATFTVTNGEKGIKGDGVELRYNEETDDIEWRQEGNDTDTWAVLFSLSALLKKDEQNNNEQPNDNQQENQWDNNNLTFYSNGLIYEARTIGGVSGFVVTGWDNLEFDDNLLFEYGTDFATVQQQINYYYSSEGMANSHLIIPDYIGSVPVIGVAAKAGLNFAKVTLSSNTIYLGDEAFYNCSRLKEIDFNNAKIKQIPIRCFKNTALTSVSLPDTVIALQESAFENVFFYNFDISNIVWFGGKCLNCLMTNYVYIPSSVQYIGENAFYYSRLYLESAKIPETWPSVITSTNKENATITVNCKRNEEYIYSIDEDEVTVYQYLGNERTLTVASSIEGKPVTKIGYGFASICGDGDELFDTIEEHENEPDFYSLVNSTFNPVDIIYLPVGIKEIGRYAFLATNEIIVIPNTIESIYQSSIECVVDDDLGLKYYVFEGTSAPSILKDNGDPITSITKESLLEASGFRCSFGVERTRLFFDDLFCYQDDGYTYSILAYMNCKTAELIVPATFNEKKVATVLRNAIVYDYWLKSIEFSAGIQTIRPYAVNGCNLKRVYIPSSVAIINANGIRLNNSSANIYVEAYDKPIDWDSNWTNYPARAIYGVGKVFSNGMFDYTKNGNQIALLSCLRYFDNIIYIPAEIDGLPVKEIKNLFLTVSSNINIYIPASVTIIRANAITTSARVYVYAAAESKPDGWDSSWVSYSSYSPTYNWNRTEANNRRISNCYAFYDHDGEMEIYMYVGTDSEINVPVQFDGKYVTAIKALSFSGQTALRSIALPEKIKLIEARAFKDCTNLSIINYQGTKEQWDAILKEDAWASGANITTINYAVVDNTITDFEFVYENDAYSVKKYTGNNTNITIPASYAGKPVMDIYSDAFSGYSTISLVLPNTIKTIKGYSFKENIALVGITIPSSVERISGGAFFECVNLKNVTFEKGSKLSIIGEDAFSYCTSLTSITIPASVRSLDQEAFYGCSNLNSITFEQGSKLTRIGYHAFYENAINNINLPDNVLDVDAPFTGCINLNYTTYNNAMYLGNTSNPHMLLVKATGTSIYTCTVHPDTRIIAGGAFSGCTYLYSISIPSNVISIGKDAFSGCSSLNYNTLSGNYLGNETNMYHAFITPSSTSITSGTISTNAKVIAGSAYKDCTSMTSITLPTGIKVINGSTFYRCNRLSSIDISDGVISIGSGAFSYCSDLITINIPASVIVIGEDVFYGCNSLETINFSGTKAQWEAITKSIDWNESTSNYTIVCSDGSITK